MACTTVHYWIGATNERFTIADELNESSTISITPNSGTGTGPQLDAGWIATNFGVTNKFTFREEKYHYANTTTGNAHLLIIVPNILKVTEISEMVFGSPFSMTQGLHFDSFTLQIGGKTHTAYYLRDLTSKTFPNRQFYFKVSINS